MDKGWAIKAEILAILREIPLGRHEIEAGLLLRNAMFVNGVLNSMEVRYGVTDKDMRELEKIDEELLRQIIKTSPKVPLASIYLECSVTPLRYIVMKRRLNYLHHILTRKKSELISRVYYAQKRKPATDDWVITVQNDLKEVAIDLSESEISKMTKKTFKALVKTKINDLVFVKLKQIKETHSKGKEITYAKFEIQKYLKSDKLNTKQKSLLLNLRLRMIEVATNYSYKYQGDLRCRTCGLEEETQSHLLECANIVNSCPDLYEDRISKYEDVFGHIDKQVRITKLFESVMKTREEMLQQ